jgi:hypothetical protein
MDQELKTKIEVLEAKIDAIYVSAEKSRKYFLAVLWITIIAVVLPALGLVFAIPAFLQSTVGSLEGLM